jgi:hypothetical protein
LSGIKLDLELSKLDRPLEDAAVGVAVVDDLSQGERRWDHDLVSLEVVSKLSRGDQEHIEQLLRLCVTCFSVGQDLTHVIYRSLNSIGLPFFFSFGDENRANHIGGGRDVEQECFLRYWRHHYWWCCEGLFESLERLLRFVIPYELVSLL